MAITAAIYQLAMYIVNMWSDIISYGVSESNANHCPTKKACQPYGYVQNVFVFSVPFKRTLLMESPYQ